VRAAGCEQTDTPDTHMVSVRCAVCGFSGSMRACTYEQIARSSGQPTQAAPPTLDVQEW
jgi:hypothetical protein